MNQNERILQHIQEHGSITAMEAMQEYGIMRLASRMCDIKKAGFAVRREDVKGKNRFGEETRFARYTIDA